MSKLKVIWANQAKEELRATYNFYKLLSPLGAINLKNELLNTARELVLVLENQTDEIAQNYNKIKIRHFKLIYTQEKNTIMVLRIFDISKIRKNQ
jgi:plasmid stabilization system protein ParE